MSKLKVGIVGVRLGGAYVRDYARSNRTESCGQGACVAGCSPLLSISLQLRHPAGLFFRSEECKFQFIELLHWRLRVNGFSRGEAVERSETDEECGQKCWILLLIAGFFPSANARRSSSVFSPLIYEQ